MSQQFIVDSCTIYAQAGWRWLSGSSRRRSSSCEEVRQRRYSVQMQTGGLGPEPPCNAQLQWHVARVRQAAQSKSTADPTICRNRRDLVAQSRFGKAPSLAECKGGGTRDEKIWEGTIFVVAKAPQPERPLVQALALTEPVPRALLRGSSCQHQLFADSPRKGPPLDYEQASVSGALALPRCWIRSPCG